MLCLARSLHLPGQCFITYPLLPPPPLLTIVDMCFRCLPDAFVPVQELRSQMDCYTAMVTVGGGDDLVSQIFLPV